MQDLNDEALMLAYQAGEARAFEALYRRHRPRLFRFFLHETGSTALGEELYQEAWLRVIGQRERYEVRARFSTWLYTIAHSVLMDHFRKSGRIGRFEESVAELPEVEACASTNPEGEWGSRLEARRLQLCLDGLPLEQREVFLLKEEAELGLADIAQAMACGVEAVKSRLRYALKKLRACLEASA